MAGTIRGGRKVSAAPSALATREPMEWKLLPATWMPKDLPPGIAGEVSPARQAASVAKIFCPWMPGAADDARGVPLREVDEPAGHRCHRAVDVPRRDGRGYRRRRLRELKLGVEAGLREVASLEGDEDAGMTGEARRADGDPARWQARRGARRWRRGG